MEHDNIYVLDDIAAALGLSKSTVSRAISGKGRISAATRQRVLEYAEKHDYRPNSIASSLARSRTNNISVIIPSDALTDEMSFFHGCLMGVCDAVTRNQYDVLITVVAADDMSMLEKTVRNHKVDGFILTRSLEVDTPAEFLKRMNQHFVLVGTSADDDITQVDADNEGASYQLTEHMLERHAGVLAFIVGSSGYMVNRSRSRGFYKAHGDVGRTVDAALVARDIVTQEQMIAAVDNAVNRGASAIICGDDYICKLALVRLEELKNKSMRIAAFYSGDFSLGSSAPIDAIIDIPARSLGLTAGDKLMKLIENGAPPSKSRVQHRIICP